MPTELKTSCQKGSDQDVLKNMVAVGMGLGLAYAPMFCGKYMAFSFVYTPIPLGKGSVQSFW